MALKVKPTTADLTVAKVMARHASPIQEELVSILTVAADERVLLSLAALAWLQSRQSSPTIRTRYNHLLIVASASSVLPHILKIFFNQTRPDRLTCAATYMEFLSPVAPRMLFLLAMRCIWALLHRLLALCRVNLAE